MEKKLRSLGIPEGFLKDWTSILKGSGIKPSDFSTLIELHNIIKDDDEKANPIKAFLKDITCRYCNNDVYYIFHKTKKGRIDWAICMNCLKKVCDDVLGEAKNGGRVSND